MLAMACGINSIKAISNIMPSEKPMPAATARSLVRTHSASIAAPPGMRSAASTFPRTAATWVRDTAAIRATTRLRSAKRAGCASTS